MTRSPRPGGAAAALLGALSLGAVGLGVAAASLGVASVAGCAGGGYTIAGARTRPAVMPLVPAGAPAARLALARAQPVPELSVDPPEAFPPGRPVRAGVLAHGPADAAGVRRVILKLEGPGPQVGTLSYSPPGGVALPFARGRAVVLRWLPPEEEGELRGPALVVHDAAGELLAAVAAGGGLPRGVLGEEVDLAVSRRLVYTEVRPLPSLCIASFDHVELRVQQGSAQAWLLPGTVAELPLPAGTYRLIALDAALPSGDRCAGQVRGALAFAVVRAEPDS